MELRQGGEGGIPRLSARGPMTMADNAALLEAIKGHFTEGPAYLMVVCEADLELLQSSQENHSLQDKARAFFNGVAGGAMAMVCLNDLMFAVCRQFQLLATSSRARMEVFGTIPEASDWLVSLRSRAGIGV
jgi:hypothetical protein